MKLEVRKNPLKRSKVLSAFWTPLISESKDFKEGKSKKHAIEEFIRRYPNHKGDLIINGDASGDNRTAQSEFTNYMIIKRALEAHGYNPKFRLRDFNPAILRRIQAFNAKVRNSKGDVSLFIDKR